MPLPDLARLRLGEPKAAERARLPARAGRHPALLLRVPGAEKRDPPTAERGAASNAVARERPQAFTAGRRAAKTAGPAAGPTVAALSELLEKKELELLWIMHETREREQRELEEEVKSLRQQVEEAKAAEARRAKAFCAGSVRGNLQPYMLRLGEEEEITDTVKHLRKESDQHTERLAELQQKSNGSPLSPDESHEQRQLRDITRRIHDGIAAGIKAAPLRKARREQKGASERRPRTAKPPRSTSSTGTSLGGGSPRASVCGRSCGRGRRGTRSGSVPIWHRSAPRSTQSRRRPRPWSGRRRARRRGTTRP